MNALRFRKVLGVTLTVVVSATFAQDDKHEGSAVVQVGDQEYTIPIVCEDPNRPEKGFYTEPQRVTRERTGRASGVRLTIRRWKDTTDLSVALDRYVAWVPSPSSVGGVLNLVIAMSPNTSLKDGMPVALTYDEWTAGNRPAGLENVAIEANCAQRDSAAPAFRKLPAKPD